MKARERSSYGLMCFRFNQKLGKKEVLLVKKRVTYNFVDFVLGKYDVADYEKIKYMLNHTTVEEKIEINRLDFDIIWYHAWLFIPTPEDKLYYKYYESRNKFEDLLNFKFNGKRGDYLQRLLNNSKSVGNLWDFPKGKKTTPYETSLEAAVREFREETSISVSSLFIIPDVVRKTTVKLGKRIYVTNMFLAIYRNSNFTNYVTFGESMHNPEVSEIKWMNLELVASIDILGRLYPLVASTMKIIKKEYNNAKIYNDNYI